MARLLFLFTLCVGIGAKDVSGLSCEYEMTVDHALYGENVEMLKNSDPASCKEACDALRDGCKSFDFNANSGSCFLSDETKDTAPDMFGKHAKMDYFQKTTCVDGETTPDNDELPLDVDCPIGWVGGQHGQCYMLDHECSLTWENAKEQCNNIGAYLLAIDDFSELTYIRELLENEDQYVRWWTSGYREKYTDTWKWDDGDQSDVEVFDWHYPEPNNFKGREDKIAIMYDETFGPGAWAYNDDSPHALRSFICEAKPQEIRVGCDASPCRNGGRCVTIYSYGNNLDTWLLTTKDEENQVKFRCRCDDKYKGPTCQYENPDYADQTMWHTIGDSQYHFHTDCGLSRNKAKRHCEVENGDLVALGSQQEMREVKELMEELGLTENIDYFWTSGAKLGDWWYWEQLYYGVSSMYMDWGWIEGEPNGWLGKENYTEWRFGDVYGFNDVGEKKKNAYICEKPAYL